MHRTRIGVVWARCHACGVESTMPVHQERRRFGRARRAAARIAVCIVCTVSAGTTVGLLLPAPAAPQRTTAPARARAPRLAPVAWQALTD